MQHVLIEEKSVSPTSVTSEWDLNFAPSDDLAVLADLDVDVGYLLAGLCVAHVGKLAHVLHRVAGPLATHILHASHHHAETVEVFGDLRGILHATEVLLSEESIEKFAVLNLLLKVLVGLRRALLDDSVVVSLEVDIAGADS